MVDVNKPLDIVVVRLVPWLLHGSASNSAPLDSRYVGTAAAEIGGSLAGLFASVPLLRLPVKHRITILERSPTPLLHSTGAGIVAGSETLQFFTKFDRSHRKAPDEISILSRARYYLDKNGSIIDEERMSQRMMSWEMAYYLLRWNVDGLQSPYVVADQSPQDDERSTGLQVDHDRIRYRYGCDVESVVDRDDKVEVKFRKLDADRNDLGEETVHADFVVVADGPSSRIRKQLLGGENSDRDYAGYVAFRGTVCESELSEEAKAVFVQKFTFFHASDPNTQILAYTIPGPDGTLQPGQRLVNWVWYWNFDQGSGEYEDLMTDNEGKRHRLTVPTGGKMRQDVLERQRGLARQYLPPQFVEVIMKSPNPFVQAITDLRPPTRGTEVGRLMNGKALIVGDALSGFRPHTAASTSQAAFHGLMLDAVFRGEMTWKEYEAVVLDYAWNWQTRGVMLGDRSQFGSHPLAAQQDGPKVDRGTLWMRE